jgi:hypothetical protein
MRRRRTHARPHSSTPATSDGKECSQLRETVLSPTHGTFDDREITRMGEAGLGPGEVAKEISEHAKHAGHSGSSIHDRVISIIEAGLLAIVALTAAWSGYSSAKWSTESRLTIAEASTARNDANTSEVEGLELRLADALLVNAWLAAHSLDDSNGERLALNRFSPNLRTAFDEWIALDPDANPDAPAGPQSMPAYEEPNVEESTELKERSERLSAQGNEEGIDGDEYVRITVYLATVLFLVGISTQFPIRVARYGLIGIGVAILAFSVTQLVALPSPP